MKDSMILVKAARFERGSTRFPNEGPVINVRLSPFMIDIFPATNSDFSEFIASGSYRERSLWSEEGWLFINGNRISYPNYWNDPCWNHADMPVTGVSWWEAMAYAKYRGKSLPTEAQWEYAAGFGLRTYPWGEDFPSPKHANYAPGCEPSRLNRRATLVNALPFNTSASGCRDMAGNVAEWCLDNASDSYEWDQTGVNPLYITNETDPHIVRGGSGLHDEDSLRCASRDHYSPRLRDNIVGIRCVINLRD